MQCRKIDTSLKHLILHDMLKLAHTPIKKLQVTEIHMQDEI